MTQEAKKPPVEDDSSYNSDAEPDSDTDEPEVGDPEALLQTWLGELDSLNMGLDTASSSGSSQRPASSSSVEKYYHVPRTDSYRLSMAVLEDSQDVELDAILGELCALENQFEKEIQEKRPPSGAKPAEVPGEDGLGPLPCKRPQPSLGGGARPKFEISYTADSEWTQRHDKGARTESPDNDSAFSDNLSLLSSESSASSGGSGSGSGVPGDVAKPPGSGPTAQADQAARVKAEKIKLALEKIKEANVKKLFIKVFNTADGSTKSLLVDEKMSVGHVTRLLADKNHVRMDPRWAIVEHLPDLLMERIYEDHESLVENLMLWTRDSQNRLHFQERPDKYDLFARPEHYLLPPGGATRALDDEARAQLAEEFFTTRGATVPEVESELWLKAEGKKAWKRQHFVLRASGIYYAPKGKTKNSKDLVCLAKFDVNQVYYGVGWRKKYKAPSDYCFAIKHPQVQVKAPKHIRYLCADDPRTLQLWVMGIRIAKCGRRLPASYRQLSEQLAQDDIDRLAQARSFSLASVAPPGGSGPPPPPPSAGEHAERLSQGSSSWTRQDSVISRSSGSSRSASPSVSTGCASGPTLSSPAATNGAETGFDSEHPQGTIKRKPTMTPKLPLTSTTRLLVKSEECVRSQPSSPARRPPGAESGWRRRGSEPESDTLRSTGSGRSVDSVDTVVAAGGQCSDSESLPPPPPELAGSTLSLSSLPPPPDDLLTSPVTSLPPPPRAPVLRQESPPPGPAQLPPPMPPIEPIYSSGAPQRRVKRITFGEPEVLGEPVYAGRAGKAPPPPPPKRSHTTRLSSQAGLLGAPVPSHQLPPPNRLDSPLCHVSPPQHFLRDLQRVMHKKWSVSEKCKVDLKSPHEVLGFRDPYTMDPAKEQHVDQWLQQHYGSAGKRRPPPPPRRNETTQLSGPP